MGKTIKVALSTVSMVWAMAWCGGGGEGAYDRNAPYGAYTMTTVWEADLTRLDGTTGVFAGRLTEEVVDGTAFKKFLLESDTSSMDLLLAPLPTESEDGMITFGGCHSTTGVSIEPVGEFSVDMGGAVGVPTPLQGPLEIMVPPMTAPVAMTLDGSYTLVADDAVAESSMGQVHGCRHYSAEGQVTGSGLPVMLDGVALHAELWYHPSLGVVRYELPALGLAGDLGGTWDLEDGTGEFGTIRKVGILDAASPRFELSSFDLANEFDADKNTHAKMLLELRWVDEERARTGPEPSWPAVEVEFGTVLGIFPWALVDSPVSIFHPEENGQGFKYWIGFVDEAARNEPGEGGIAYHVSVDIDPDITPALRATARIYYRRLP